ncbi:MAG: ribonuclease H, partial [Gammaproteobacteria bacterium]
VLYNLYVVFIPYNAQGSGTDIESLFDDTDLLKKHNGRWFSGADKEGIKLSKADFARHIVKRQKKSINFKGFNVLLTRVTGAIEHYSNSK